MNNTGSRSTPPAGSVRRTPHQPALAPKERGAGVAGARALSLLVDRLTTLGLAHDLDGARGAPVRDALRQLVSRTRGANLVVCITNGLLDIEGTPLDSRMVRDDPLLFSLQLRLLRKGIGRLTIRDGAAPGELLTLGRLLAESVTRPSGVMQAVQMDTPTETVAFSDNAAPHVGRELLRSWSVLVQRAGESDEVPQWESVPTPAFMRLESARTDEAATKAVDDLVDDVDEFVARGDAHALEHIACALANAVDVAGAGAGRLAVESGFRRLLRADVIRLLAQQLPVATDRRALLSVFARSGESGVRALVESLIGASGATERRAYFDTIVSLDVGGALLRNLLHDPRWYVVRNTAALLGEMGVSDADESLARFLSHSDERLRIAAARALIRLRSPRALQALQAAVDDTNAEVRRIAATSFAVAVTTPGIGRPPTAQLAAALERESDEDVALEMMAALGRLGSADAVQRLLRIAQSPTVDTPAATGAAERGYVAYPSWVRVAALEALVDARGSAVSSAIDALINDADPLVGDAAMRLVSNMNS